MTYEEIIEKYPVSLPVKVAAEFIDKPEMWIRIGLRNNAFPFGCAIKGSGRWTYHIPTHAFMKYLGLE